VSRRAILLIALCLAVLGAAPAVAQESRRGTLPPSPPTAPKAVPGELIVRFGSSVSAAQRADIRRDAGVRAVRALPAGYQLVRVEEATSTAQAAAALERRSGVRSVERNYDRYRPLATPNDPLFTNGLLWGLHHDPLSVPIFGGVEDADIDAPEAWDLARGSSGVVVAVVDTGMQLDHPDLAPRLWTNPGEVPGNGEDDDKNGYIDDVHGWNVNKDNAALRDTSGHGTHVAGTIGAAGNNGLGMTGVAWDSRLMVVKVLDPTATDAQLAEALDYAAKHAHIVNASLGGYGPPSSLVDEVVARHPDKLFVFAAGNDGVDVETYGVWPCQTPGDNVICVGASDPDDKLAWFSNFGAQSVHLAAPGEAIVSAISRRIVVSDDFEDDAISSQWTVGGTWVIARDAEDGYAATAGAGTLTLAEPLAFGGRDECRVHWWGAQTAEGIARAEISTDGATWTTLQAFEGTAWESYEAPIPSTDGLRVRCVSDGGGAVGIDAFRVSCVVLPGEAVYHALSGTSMAAPHVAGAAAVLLSVRPSAGAAELREALLEHGDPLSKLAGKTVTGRRLNLFNALREFMEPEATTGQAAVSGRRARLTGAVRAYAATQWAFEWGPTAALGERTDPRTVGDTPGAVDVEAELDGLAAGATYHYRLVAYRGGKAYPGEVRTFATEAEPEPAPSPAPEPPAPAPDDGSTGGTPSTGQPSSTGTGSTTSPRTTTTTTRPRLGADAKVTCTASPRRGRIRRLTCRVTGTGIRTVTVRLLDRRSRTVASGSGRPRRTLVMRRRGVTRGRYTARITIVGTNGRTVVVRKTVRL
jgi:subtilisin family serine protease